MMADFHQTGVVATLHRLETGNLDTLERELQVIAGRRAIALVLPCLFAEFSRPAIRHIIEELRHVRYLDTIVVSLGKATREQLLQARRAFEGLPQKIRIIWNDGPSMHALYALLRDSGVDAGEDGKGRSCWIAYGYLLAEGRADVIAAHDCDITTYSRELLARLCYPVASPELDFAFAKGYYARVGTAMNGRVTRLFVAPIIRALQATLGSLRVLEYLHSFRYPLSGEFAMKAELAQVTRLPGNWGVEIGALAEAYRHCHTGRICQTELCGTYDHKHQVVSAANPGQGLFRMSVDIGATLLRALAGEGVAMSEAQARALIVRYVRDAEDEIDAYAADARINSLVFDRHGEEDMVAVFARGLRIAIGRHLEDPLAVPLMPSWRRVAAAVPGVFEILRSAVEEDSGGTTAPEEQDGADYPVPCGVH
jgi:glucosyl-3-phosphoglycerate synthase